MARRHRCVHCKKLFWPNYRNRTKTSGRQRVCETCGPLIGHRFADQRYRQIRGLMPIPCVDLLVVAADSNVLLVKRANEPAAGQWWYPGGRVHFCGVRKDAATRKLREECGLEPRRIEELGTFDVLLELESSGGTSQGITTLFLVEVDTSWLRLDAQSSEGRWASPAEWEALDVHPFVKRGLSEISRSRDAGSSEPVGLTPSGLQSGVLQIGRRGLRARLRQTSVR